jgi:hypothetical protein
MGRSRRASIALVLLATAAAASPVRAVPLAIANHSFESPAMGDGGFDFLMVPTAQGTWGWSVEDGAFIYNPLATDYIGAGANGAPQGADGAQIGGVYQFGDYAVYQLLAGADQTPGTLDDPVLETGTVYTITFAVGQRSLGNPVSTYGGYDVQLRAGPGAGQTILGRETNVETPPPGTFITRTFSIVCPTFDHPEAIGQPLVVLLRKTTVSSTATIEYDNIRIDATKVSPQANANFNETGGVNAADLALWRANYGANRLDATHGHGNANTDDYVDGADFLLWQRQLGPPPSAAAGASVPEPTSALLAAGALIAAAFMRTSATRRR